MNKLITILFIIVIVNFSFADSGVLTSEQEDQLATLSEILHFIYEDNPSAIPSDVNDIVALGESASSRDMLALALIQMMKDVYEGKTNPAVEQTVDASPTLEATTAEEQLDTNADMLEESLVTLQVDKKIIPDWGPIRYTEAKSLKKCISRTNYFRGVEAVATGKSLDEFSSRKLLREVAFLEQSQSISLSTEQPQDEAVSEVRQTLFSAPESVIEVSPGNVPAIWTKDNTYHVTGDVVLPPACYFEPGVHISRATNSRMISDPVFPPIMSGTPEDKIWIYPDTSPYNYGHYVSGIEYNGLSGKLKMRYVVIEGANYGVKFKNCMFNENIHHLYLFNNVYGIYADSNEDIKLSFILAVNNYYTGIEVYLNEACDVKITQSTIDYTPWDGIIILGPAQETDCTAIVANTAVTRCGLDTGSGPNPNAYGIQTYGYLYASIYGMGYHGNSNDNPAGFIEFYPVSDPNFPYESNGAALGSHFLKKTSLFNNGGVGYVKEVPQILTCTANVDNMPLAGVLPIGFCYTADPNFTNEGLGYVAAADVDSSKGVDLVDFAVLGKYWLLDLDPNTFDPNTIGPNDIDPYLCDFDDSYMIDMNDLAQLSDEWLLFGSGVPQLALLPDNDPNGNGQYTVLSYRVEFSLADQMDGYDYYLFRDGHYIDRFKGDFNLTETLYAEDETFKAVNGPHHYRVAACSRTEALTVIGKAIPYELSNSLNGVASSACYDPNHSYVISGFNDANEPLNFEVFNMEEAAVWDVNVPTGGFGLVIDPNVFYTPLVSVPGMINPYCTYSFTVPETQMMLSGFGDPAGWSDEIVERFNIRTWQNRGTKSLLIAPNRRVYRSRTESNNAWCQAMRNRNLVPITGLFGGAATREAQDFMFNDSSLRSIRINAHGNYRTLEDKKRDVWVKRTKYELGDGTVCFSWITSVDSPSPNPDYFLPGDYEQTGYSVRSARNWDALPYLYVDADFCYSGHARMTDGYYTAGYTDPPVDSGTYSDDAFWNGMDMARWGFEIAPLGETRRRIYHGWYGEIGENQIGLTGVNNWMAAMYGSWGATSNPDPYYGAHAEATTTTSRGPEVHRQKTYCGNQNSYLSN
ncbi:MAG: hypothetical protein B6I25_06340 [Planctomycetales bacterium 4572_13]|nr:MAG: hypothetical protein B6I25_06340 [Planctomycetales bacterium 4572_13]